MRSVPGRQPLRQAAIGFTSDRISLEGIITLPDGTAGPFPAVLVCHPHPALGGDMDNAVVTALSKAAIGRGIATMRFNFRGVGGSEGQSTDEGREQRDVRAALDVLRHWPGVDGKRVALAGYSFGASVVLGGLKRYGAARCVVLIAPPVSSVREARIRQSRRPMLFLVGSRDRIVPSSELQRALDGIGHPVHFSEIAGGDHSLRGKEGEVADRAADFIVEKLAE